jgi:hypothetical protein
VSLWGSEPLAGLQECPTLRNTSGRSPRSPHVRSLSPRDYEHLWAGSQEFFYDISGRRPLQ